jgi:molybdopterin converting factor small subunit
MATVTVRIPAPLRSFTGGAGELEAVGATVGEVLSALGARHDGLTERVLAADGSPRSFVNLFLGQQDVRALAGLETPVREGDVLSIVPAVAGGRP